MTHRLPKYLILFFMMVSVSACTQSPKPMGKPLPDLNYTYLTPYHVHGGATQIRQSAVIDVQTAKAMQEMVIAPDALIKHYAASRFVSVNQNPHVPVKAVFDVTNLSFHKALDENNMIGILTGAAAEFYTLNLFVALSPVDGDGNLMEPYTIKLKRELLIPDAASLAEREILQFEFLEKVIQDIDQTITNFMTQLH